MDLTQLPFNRHIGIQRSDRPGTSLMLAGEERYTNHLGTVHASALFALAEAASGECLVQMMKGNPVAVVPVVRRVEAKFRRPGNGAVYAQGHVTPEAQTEFLARLTTRGAAQLAIAVEVSDAAGTSVLLATVEWFVAKAK